MKTLTLLALSMIASQAHAAPSACLVAAQTKGQVIYQCSQPNTEHTVIVSKDTDNVLTLTYCASLSTGIESGTVEKTVAQYFTTYSTPEGVQGDASYELKTDNWGSHFSKRSEGDSLDFDMTCGLVGSL
jgi:hypothetical protein